MLTRTIPDAPAKPGDTIDDIDTPALVIDLDALESNLDLMAGRLPGGLRLRPHAKTHKSAEISKLQMSRGAIGVCCQKTAEAQALVDAGVDNVMVSNQVVGKAKLARLAKLTHRATIFVCVDDSSNVADLGAAMTEHAPGKSLHVLVEIDVGNRRCGVSPGDEAIELAQQVSTTAGLSFEGLQAYQGNAQHLRSPKERHDAIAEATRLAQLTVDGLTARGLRCNTIAGAGTGTFEHEIASGLYNELQTGSYVFMDADYARNLDDSGNPISTFRHALFVLSTVMSSTAPGHAVLDAGHKSVAIDSGLPKLWTGSGFSTDSQITGMSDEHGVLAVDESSPTPATGSRVLLVPGHCDPTVNLHDWYVAVRNNRVESVWPVTARGALF